MKVIIVLFIALASFFAPAVQAETENKADPVVTVPKADYTALRQINIYTVDQVIDPLRVRLKNGDIIQLSTIEIPDYDPYEPGKISAKAFEHLKSLLPEDTRVRLYQTKDAEQGRENRMGYRLGHLEIKDHNLWVQGSMLMHGHARILPSTQNVEMAEQMLALEANARDNKRGLWQEERYGTLTPKTAADRSDGWAVVEGEILKTAIVRNTVYLNFGDNWRDDFTIAVKSQVRRKLAQQGIDLLNMSRTKVRIHGWLERYNGPYIELNHPVWLEILLPEEDESTMLPP